MNTESTHRIGDYLVQQGHITPAQREKALEIQKKEPGRLGEILVGVGAVNTLVLHRALAEILQLPFVDMVDEPADKALLKTGMHWVFLEHRLIPWRQVNGRLVVAVSDYSERTLAEVRRLFGEHVDIAITTPEDIFHQVQKSYAGDMDDHAIHYLWRFAPQRSAKQLFSPHRRQVVIGPLALALIVAVIWGAGLLSVLVVVNALYLAALLFRFHLFWAGLSQKKFESSQITITPQSLPVYTLLIPVFKEPPQTIRTLLNSIRALDYPRAKLDVKLIVESSDTETINNILAEKPERIFQIVRVPYSLPQTKPKACNYALQFARGEFVTIYDAEDIPDPQQLKAAVQHFEEGGPQLGCLQARLNYYNRNDNALTRCFAIEYAMWFDAMLFGLEQVKLPIPLGGTSNHFRTRVLKEIYAWDPFNVTEDADIGIRLAEHGYKTRILNSLTMEEAPNSFINWVKQRTRWIKGYIQTFIVHLREPHQTGRRLGFGGLLGFMLFVGSSSFAYLVTPLILVVSALAYFEYYTIPLLLYALMWANLIGGLALHYLIALSIVIARRWWEMLWIVPFYPVYWLLHSVASFRALIQLLGGAGHKWEKTRHGLYKTALAQ